MPEQRGQPDEKPDQAGTLPLVLFLVALIALFGFVYYARHRHVAPPATFAQCLAAKQVTLYGLYWCDHCAEQERMFGDTIKYVRYVECGIQGSRAESPACLQAGVKNFPTWKFPDGSLVEGARPLSFISEKSGCSLR
jgi:hypothetical protein